MWVVPQENSKLKFRPDPSATIVTPGLGDEFGDLCWHLESSPRISMKLILDNSFYPTY
jgi:hypothetical protein